MSRDKIQYSPEQQRLQQRMSTVAPFFSEQFMRLSKKYSAEDLISKFEVLENLMVQVSKQVASVQGLDDKEMAEIQQFALAKVFSFKDGVRETQIISDIESQIKTIESRKKESGITLESVQLYSEIQEEAKNKSEPLKTKAIAVTNQIRAQDAAFSSKYTEIIALPSMGDVLTESGLLGLLSDPTNIKENDGRLKALKELSLSTDLIEAIFRGVTERITAALGKIDTLPDHLQAIQRLFALDRQSSVFITMLKKKYPEFDRKESEAVQLFADQITEIHKKIEERLLQWVLQSITSIEDDIVKPRVKAELRIKATNEDEKEAKIRKINLIKRAGNQNAIKAITGVYTKTLSDNEIKANVNNNDLTRELSALLAERKKFLDTYKKPKPKPQPARRQQVVEQPEPQEPKSEVTVAEYALWAMIFGLIATLFANLAIQELQSIPDVQNVLQSFAEMMPDLDESTRKQIATGIRDLLGGR